MLLVFALGLAGCVDVDVTLDEHGSGAFKLVWTAPNPRLDPPRFSSAHVKIQSVSRMGPGVFSLTGTFDDVTKLPTADFFRQLTIRREPAADQERIRVFFRNPKVERIPNEQRGVWVVNIGAVLPAPVRFANRAAEVTGNRVAWHVPLSDFQENRFLKLSLRYGPGGVPRGIGTPRPARRTAADGLCQVRNS